MNQCCREALERAAKCAEDHRLLNMSGGSTGNAYGTALAITKAIRALADQPEADGKNEIRHTIAKKLRAAFEPDPPAKALPPCDSNSSKAEILYNHEKRIVQLEENAFGGPAHTNPVPRVRPLEAKVDTLPLGHRFKRCGSPTCAVSHCIARDGVGVECCEPEAAHGRKRE